MKGCRPFSDAEVIGVLGDLAKNRTAARDRALFVLGLRAGFRISELLSLRIGDVIQNGNCVDFITVQKRNMKKKVESRSLILHPEAKAALLIQIAELERQGRGGSDSFLFRSRQGENKAITRIQAWAILRKSYANLGLPGKLGTHGMRKTFARGVYELLKKDLRGTQELMGHKNIDSTGKYLSFNQTELNDAVLKLK